MDRGFEMRLIVCEGRRVNGMERNMGRIGRCGFRGVWRCLVNGFEYFCLELLRNVFFGDRDLNEE